MRISIVKWAINRTLNIQAIEIEQDKVAEKLKQVQEDANELKKKLNGAVKGAEPMLADK